MGKKISKVIYMDDDEHVWCSREQEYIHHTEFETNKVGEYKLHCIKCSEEISGIRTDHYHNGAQERSDYVREQSRLMLENIGYKYDSDYTIHEQFLIKHNLVK